MALYDKPGAFRAVVWDVDGTLVDSEPLHDEAIGAVCARYGYTLTAAEFAGFTGHGMEVCFARLQGVHAFPIDLAAFNDACSRYYVAHARTKVPPRPGARERVLAIASGGIVQGCASNSDRIVVAANVAILDAGDAIAVTVARDDVANGKPAPDIYEAACRGLGVAPAQTLVVEDTATGVAAARAAGCTVIAWPNEKTAAMDFGLAHHVVAEIADFPWAARLALA